MIPGPENLSLIHVTQVTEQWPGPGPRLGAEPPSEFIYGYIRDQPGKEAAGPSDPRGGRGDLRGGQRPAVPCCEPPGLRLDFSAEQQLLFFPGPAPFSWVCFCTPASVSSSIREQHSGTPRQELLGRVKCVWRGEGHVPVQSWTRGRAP